MLSVSQVKTPAFLVDKAIVQRNCQRMREKCQSLALQLRPHMKTHKTVEGGVLMTGGSRRGIVVSTIAEAYFYANNGFDDILYAYPLSHDKITSCKHLTEQLSKFSVLVDSTESLKEIARVRLASNKTWHVFVGINTGYAREGVPFNAQEKLLSLVKGIADHDKMHFEGLYTHCGQSYSAKGKTQIQSTADGITDKLLLAKRILHQALLPCPVVSLGSTPTCSHLTEKSKCLTEVHPGNYIFYDAQQKQLGACTAEDIACQVITRVIGHYPHDNQILIDCGFAALSHDGAKALPTGYAEVVSHPELQLQRMSQEIGIITTIDGSPIPFSSFPLGSMLYLYPYHSCATAMMHPSYLVVENGQVVEKWYPNRGWIPEASKPSDVHSKL